MGFPGCGLNRIFRLQVSYLYFFPVYGHIAVLPAEHSAMPWAQQQPLCWWKDRSCCSPVPVVMQQVRPAPGFWDALPQVPSRTGLPPSAVAQSDVSVLSLAPWMGVITSIITQELEVGRKRSFVWVVREKRGWLRRQGSESANHAEPVLCQAGNN